MSVILKAENISKQYRLGTVGTGSLQHDLNRWWHQIRGKEDPYLKVGGINDRSVKANEEYVWALKDINFEVKQGEVLGIIGKNGAGKSTLLKILSRVTAPTTGSIKTRGRIASLLEVGTGFHGELTGRENIFMNGAVLGMSKAEIKAKLDEIIAFSGCEKYIDTPVKRYSSGMTVRLGFAVAAHLEPEILVVDEVLAVGDAEFQKKAIGKMQDLSTGEGRTVLFVSHNMVSIQQLCSRCVLLENGNTIYEGDVYKAVTKYLLKKGEKQNLKSSFPVKLRDAIIQNFYITNCKGSKTSDLFAGSSYAFTICLKNESKNKIEFNVRLQLFDEREELITTLNTFHTNNSHLSEPNEQFELQCMIKKMALVPGKYCIGIEILDLISSKVLFEHEKFENIKVNEGDFFNSGRTPSTKNLGKFFTEYSWQKNEL
ncbi:ABC transporter ATP-binding protein [Autumnicola psychrophila]|uniref:ABC transporter ATP-binding protein n=1 Tax=Autumnicola psychrophila TaxID=3075592 RepID=A0ABU3DT24_9FLAO|nr:ABC transporter ATP-binding protein [Zunongwangia sp. F225]MDT0686865.1 ABC transporter ATP-binding protein [Zunongwangia sp. F225]